MPVVAVTGNLCSGKSTVLDILKKKGGRVFSADDAIHRYYKNKQCQVYKEVKNSFPSACDKKGNIIRKRLGCIFFAYYKKLKRLEEIVHPHVAKDVRKWVKSKQEGEGLYLAEIPLLFEKKLDRIFDRVILVYSPQSILVERIKRKFGLSKKESLKRLKLFSPLIEKKKRSHFIIANNSDLLKLKRKVGLIWRDLKRKR
ncbi:MAG: dephospho-CoA kinase [Candidatus Omnitrophota bacterium]